MKLSLDPSMIPSGVLLVGIFHFSQIAMYLIALVIFVRWVKKERLAVRLHLTQIRQVNLRGAAGFVFL
ncbi:MAG: hypothetical protein AB7O96_08950 [Pseudobdellovibrionaceae bacterium]